MQEKIKNLYSELTGGKNILTDNYLISIRHFNSISGDRFVSELKKIGIYWDGIDISFKDLLKNYSASIPIVTEYEKINIEADNVVVNPLPVCR